MLNQEQVQVVHPYGDYKGPPILMPRPGAGKVWVAEYTLLLADSLLNFRNDECVGVAAQLKAAVEPTPWPKRGEPEPPPRFWPVAQAVLEHAAVLLDHHGGCVSEACGKQFLKAIELQKH